MRNTYKIIDHSSALSRPSLFGGCERAGGGLRWLGATVNIDKQLTSA